MKAAVIYQNSKLPQYVEFPNPEPATENEILVSVKAVAIKNFDKGQASGTHYTSEIPNEKGKVIGSDGVCLLEDGTRVYGIATSGMLAEKATISKDRYVKIPDALDDATAAALPNAVFGAAMALKYKAGIKPGDVVLINGATGFTGRIAVQIAKHYGAGKVIVTGRNLQSLTELLAIGADDMIQVSSDDRQFSRSIEAIQEASPINIVIDYLWGQTAEIILNQLKGDGGFGNPIQYVSVGSMAGDEIKLSSMILRSSNLQLTGSGLGSWTREEVGELFSSILPEMFQLAAEKKIVLETLSVPIDRINSVWELEVTDGKRLVVTI